jgi:hypothetical protein
MTATISPPIVQLAFGFGNLICARWLAMRGLSGQAATEDIEMFARKGVFSSIGRAARAGDRCGGGADGVRAVAGSGRLRAIGQGPVGTTATSDATDFSARRGTIAAAAAPPRQRLLPASSAPALRSPRPRTAATIMTPTAITAAARSRESPAYYGGGPPITAVAVLWRRIWYYGGVPITAAIRSPAGIEKFKQAINPPATVAGGFFLVVGRPLTRWPRVSISFGDE